MNATMNLRERNNSGDCAQLRNNSFGVSATSRSCMLRCALRLISRLSSLVLCANPDRTWQITYGLSWIFLFLPAEIRKETGNDGAEDVAREVHARWKRVILSRREGKWVVKAAIIFQVLSCIATRPFDVVTSRMWQCVTKDKIILLLFSQHVSLLPNIYTIRYIFTTFKC